MAVDNTVTGLIVVQTSVDNAMAAVVDDTALVRTVVPTTVAATVV